MFVVIETITTFDEITIKRSLYVNVLQRCNYTDEHGKLYNYKKQVCFHLQRIKASSWVQKKILVYTSAIRICPAGRQSFYLY